MEREREIRTKHARPIARIMSARVNLADDPI